MVIKEKLAQQTMNDNFNLVTMVDKLLLPGVVARQTKKNTSVCAMNSKS